MTQKILEEIKENIQYDPGTGLFMLVRDKSNVKSGQIAGSLCGNGYIRIVVNYKRYYAHRLAWLFVNGTWPANDIDHINGIKTDNRYSNLRDATKSNNQHNRSTPRNNTSGIKGVCWDKHANKWLASCKIEGVGHHIGLFTCISDAEKAVREFRENHHGKFANHGK